MLNRRDFLKLSGAGIGGLLLSSLAPGPVSGQGGQPTRQGRVAFDKVSTYDAPSRLAVKLNTFTRDSLIPINGKVFGGEAGDYNRAWYRVGDYAYVYAGGIQLVENILNPTIFDLPESGRLGEVSVPYCESWWGIHREQPAPASRLYYQSTHWIAGAYPDPRDGSIWYRAFDHLYEAEYYIRPSYIRLLGDEEFTPLARRVGPQEKRIEVILDEQRVTAYEAGQPVFTSGAATGRQGAETPAGIFTTFHKRPTVHMVGGDGITSLYDLVGVPWATYVTDTGVAFHGAFWHNDFGKPRSFGCINLTPDNARWVYRWTMPVVPAGKNLLYQPGSGTTVLIAEDHAHLLSLRRKIEQTRRLP
ncbi:MAG: twin-arginine translocation signal domain-containing protein [Chloroflexi bacterium]|nr:twin-arginine translocation signal domain-containing protein [Chloroflexota bacterium]